jgi:hypothetical protein
MPTMITPKQLVPLATRATPASRNLCQSQGSAQPLAIGGYRAAAIFVTERDRGLSAGALKPSICAACLT